MNISIKNIFIVMIASITYCNITSSMDITTQKYPTREQQHKKQRHILKTRQHKEKCFNTSNKRKRDENNVQLHTQSPIKKTKAIEVEVTDVSVFNLTLPNGTTKEIKTYYYKTK